MSPLLTTTLAALALLSSVSLQVQAGPAFVGCVSELGSESVQPDFLGTAATPAACNTNCLNGEIAYQYSLYSEMTGDCLCSTTAVAPSYYVTGPSSTAECGNSDYLVSDLPTSFNFVQCYSNMVTDNNPGDQTSFQGCFDACRLEGSAMVLPGANGAFACRCNQANIIDLGNNENSYAVNCGPNAWFNYVHTAEAQASGLARRKLKERLDQLRLDSQTLCPTGLTPCNVQDYSDTYECIDTRNELESCGGCLHGVFQASSPSTVGVDCTAIPGVAFGAVTCMDSHCAAFSCKDGFEMAGNSCVPTY
ncbi:hypothetical protein IAR55_006934 [Kwoniella newhampshirensis]|uniref:Protein CPL1-like domain-containing protein n=1 Tax=Kwoniella newhampshirensis TaxID=1651941 RepID=A0AAW0YEW5_9TREE